MVHVVHTLAMPGSSTYSASKFAVEAYSDALRREVAGFNISVSVIKPAYVKSAIFASGDAASAQVHTPLLRYVTVAMSASTSIAIPMLTVGMCVVAVGV